MRETSMIFSLFFTNLQKSTRTKRRLEVLSSQKFKSLRICSIIHCSWNLLFESEWVNQRSSIDISTIMAWVRNSYQKATRIPSAICLKTCSKFLKKSFTSILKRSTRYAWENFLIFITRFWSELVRRISISQIYL